MVEQHAKCDSNDFFKESLCFSEHWAEGWGGKFKTRSPGKTGTAWQGPVSIKQHKYIPYTVYLLFTIYI